MFTGVFFFFLNHCLIFCWWLHVLCVLNIDYWSFWQLCESPHSVSSTLYHGNLTKTISCIFIQGIVDGIGLMIDCQWCNFWPFSDKCKSQIIRTCYGDVMYQCRWATQCYIHILKAAALYTKNIWPAFNPFMFNPFITNKLYFPL